MSEQTPQRLTGLEIETEDRDCADHGPYVARRLLGRIWSSCPECQKARDAQRLIEAMEEAKLRRID